jgi:Trypsin-like peptidase domain/MAP3K TRAFs-binding domain
VAWDPLQSERELREAVDALDQPRAADLCEQLIAHLRAHDAAYELSSARTIIRLLREQRHFLLLQRVADAFIQSGLDDPAIRIGHAQALVDQDNLIAAEAVLDRLVADTSGQDYEHAVAHGLLGRTYKQMYVATGPGAHERRQRFLERAIAQYGDVYRESKRRWHGINAVALLMRAHQDGIDLEGVADPQAEATAMAREILDEIERLGDAATTWDRGIAMEACIALGESDTAMRRLNEYLAVEARAFEIASTLRQLTEVWGLDASTPLVSVLKAALLDDEETTSVVVGSSDIGAATRAPLARDPGFEKLLGTERFESLRWFQTALERCRGVARIEDSLAGPLGTGFLVNGTAIHNSFPAVVLVTNAHVVSEEAPQATVPDKAVVTFRALEDVSATYRIKRILWSSPPDELDTTIVELDARPEAALPSPVARRRPQMDVSPPPRTYIIGHPSGADQVMLSVADNQLLDHDDVRVQYRTPTMGGSSGSPVYNRSWELIAVHHAGSMQMKRLGGQTGTYPANEGIWFACVVEEIKRGLG